MRDSARPYRLQYLGISFVLYKYLEWVWEVMDVTCPERNRQISPSRCLTCSHFGGYHNQGYCVLKQSDALPSITRKAAAGFLLTSPLRLTIDLCGNTYRNGDIVCYQPLNIPLYEGYPATPKRVRGIFYALGKV